MIKKEVVLAVLSALAQAARTATPTNFAAQAEWLSKIRRMRKGV